jgi:hypothetical protein
MRGIRIKIRIGMRRNGWAGEREGEKDKRGMRVGVQVQL